MKTLGKLSLSSALVAAAIILSNSILADPSGSITILAPTNGADLANGSGNMLQYNIHLSPTGNHVHVYIDEQDPIIVRKVSQCPCSIDLPELTQGQHKIVMKEATSSHNLTGVEGTVTVNVK